MDFRAAREQEVVRDIAHAFLTSRSALEVYRRALARLTPLVGASFSSVFLRDRHDPDLLKLECAQNWPQASARFLGQLRIRVGRGPTGRAVGAQQPVEVPDIFADPSLREWWEAARELGFAALISLPLASGRETVGAVTFYFDAPHRFEADERALLDKIAFHLGATAGRAQLVDDLRRANAQPGRRNDDLVARVREEAGRLEEELSRARAGRAVADPGPEDAVALAQRAIEAGGSPPEKVGFSFAHAVPDLPVTTDGGKVVAILANLLSTAFRFTSAGEVELSVGGDAREVWWRVRDTGNRSENLDAIFAEFGQVDGSSTRLYGETGLGLAVSRRLAGLIGGRIEVESTVGEGSVFTLTVPRC